MLRTFDTVLGHMAFLVEGGEVQAITFGYATPRAACHALCQTLARSVPSSQFVESDSAQDMVLAEQLEDRLTRYALGEEVDFDDVSISLAGMTRFQKSVLASCRAIPWGVTTTYGELANSVGHPGAARAVGTVMSSNRFPLVVPCHRVLGSGGRLGGYSAPKGLAMKERLLALEQTALAGIAHL